MVMDDIEEPQSLILVVSWKQATHSASIIRLETPPPQVHDASSPPPLPDVQWFHSSISAHVPFLPGFPKRFVEWAFSVPPATSPEDFYMLPDWFNSDAQPQYLGSLPGIIFNLTTNKCTLIMPPRLPKYLDGCAITLGDHIYYMAQPNSIPENYDYHCFEPMSEAYPCCFERYDTLSQSWEELTPLPLRSIYDTPPYNPLSCEGCILGYAVLDDTILFRMSSNHMRAYNVIKNKWYIVKVLNNLCYNIVGEAVVVNNIIYALTSNCQSLVALTFLTSQENDNGDLVFTCDLLKEYVVPGMGEIKFEHRNTYNWCMGLVHLGKNNFCVVRTCDRRGPFEIRLERTRSQYVQLTYIEVSEKKSIVTNYCVHEFKVPYDDTFRIIRCFSMPDCKSNALKEATRSFNPEDEAEVVTLPPELLQFLEEYSSQLQTNTFSLQDFEQERSVHADILASLVAASRKQASTFAELDAEVAESRRSNTDEEGDAICVMSLQFDFSFDQLFKKLKKFGHIKSVTIHPGFSHSRDIRVADVEFESSASKQNAVKASHITIGGRVVMIEEKKSCSR